MNGKTNTLRPRSREGELVKHERERERELHGRESFVINLCMFDSSFQVLLFKMM